MFVTFEGLDGSGKSTQAELCVRGSRPTVSTWSPRAPGGTELGEWVRDLVLHGGHVTPWAEALLYAAAPSSARRRGDPPRARTRGGGDLRSLPRLVRRLPGWARLGLERVLELNLAVGGLLDRTFLLSLEPAEIGSRLGGVHDRLERESAEFHARRLPRIAISRGRYPERIVVLDAARPPDELAEEVYGSLRVSA